MGSVSDFMPHGMCLLWRPGLMALHVASDAVIALSYFALPAALLLFVRGRKDLEPAHRRLALLFGAFITLCGLTHLASIVVLWTPLYVAEGWLKAATAAVSAATAVAAFILLPQILSIPSPRRLREEIEAHQATLRELETARAALSARVADTEADLMETTRRFQTAIQGSPISVFEMDDTLAYTWVCNPQLGVSEAELLGRRDDDLFPPDRDRTPLRLERAALETGRPQRGEILARNGSEARWFALDIRPAELRGGRRGLIAAAWDVTELKEREDRLKVLTRELNHRSKNLLTIVLAIVRQTAKTAASPQALLNRVEARLNALAQAHDVLAQENWSGADLASILKSQLRHQLEAYEGRILVSGDRARLPPEAAHYVGMALHELGANAVKHGALSTAEGRVEVRWGVREDPDGSRRLELVWRERGGPAVSAPAASGFGSVILTRLTPASLLGRAELDFDPEGLTWRLEAPYEDPPEVPVETDPVPA